MANIIEIKAKRIFAGPGMTAYVAEAMAETEDMEIVYVTVQEYDGTEYTVSKESVYAFLAEDNGEPAKEFIEEYSKLKDAKGSAYAEVFDVLRKVLKSL